MIGKLARQGGAGLGRRRAAVATARLDGGTASDRAAAHLSSPGLALEHKGGEWHEHAMLVTNWAERDLLAVAQIYRDRGGGRNLFDELKKIVGLDGIFNTISPAEPVDGAGLVSAGYCQEDEACQPDAVEHVELAGQREEVG